MAESQGFEAPSRIGQGVMGNSLVNSDQTRAAYARDELLSERTIMMQYWADFSKA